MKSNLYWIKVGLLIGLGLVLARYVLPFGLIALIVLVPVLLIILLAGHLARSLGSVVGHFKLKQGWAAREQRSALPR